MIVVLHSYEPEVATIDRFQRLGLTVCTHDGKDVVELSVSTQDSVHVIPVRTMKQAVWAGLRVQLARANRLFVALVDECSTAEVVWCMKEGAFDVLAPNDVDSRWGVAVREASQNQSLWLRLYGGAPDMDGGVLTGRSPEVSSVRRTIERLRNTDVCVHIRGESGVGKERVAKGLHSGGEDKAFVAINCAAIPKDLLEAELFGVEKGAFTGAMKARAGLVEQADGGTLFLDEIGELDLSLQPKLLRFLETRSARRIGGENEYTVNVRLVSATNRNLEIEVEEKRFRSDLYYRLAEVVVHVPPLRMRPVDVPELARAFLELANERFGKNFSSLDPRLVEALQRYAWPGNARELKGVIDRMVLFHGGTILMEKWWEPPAPDTKSAPVENRRPSSNALTGHDDMALGSLPSRRERQSFARKLLEEGRLSLSEVAAKSGVHPTTLFRWRKSGKV